MSAVIVGVDGSDESTSALRFAAGEARLRRLPLRVVHAFTVPTTDVWAPEAILEVAPFDRVAQERLDSTLTAVGDELKGLEVAPSIELGRPAAVLLEYASNDDLLVVGSRGRGGFKGLLLGSVSQQLVVHAPCPVVVVRSARE